MENLTTEKLLNELKLRGYYVNHIYSVEDVTNIYDVTDEGAEKVLDSVFNNEYVTDNINFFIKEVAETMGFSKKEVDLD